jgi:aldose 1-epimerase
MSLGGDEHLLTHGPYRAVVTEVGGGLRLLQHAGRDLVMSYPAGALRPRFAGSLLAPWPNRMRDGRYVLGDKTYQVPITEPERGTALHGLVVWERFDAVRHDDAAVTLTHQLVPIPGYPFEIEIEARYELGDDGLTTTVTARNPGPTTAPWGTAPHPYLLGGDGRVDTWTLHLPAGEVLDVTPDRLLPESCGPVSQAMDFRGPRQIGPTEIDHAFTGLLPDPDGLVRVSVHGSSHEASDEGVLCTWDPAVLPWVQVHTADLPDAEQSRRSLAIEPMTCAPDAFNSGAGLVQLAPGAEHTAAWTIGALTARRVGGSAG